MGAKIITDASNSARDTQNSYNNTAVASMTTLFESYGLTEPLGLGQVQSLTLKQLGAILRDIAPVLKSIGEEIADRTFESKLADAGYTTPADAVADIPNHLSGNDAVYAETTLNHTINNLGILDALVDAELMFTLLTKISEVKAAISTTAGDMTEIK